MNILKEAKERTEKEIAKLSIEEVLKTDLYKLHNSLIEKHIKEIQKEIKETN
jgi:hypothetical protein